MSRLYYKAGVTPPSLWIACALSRLSPVAITITAGSDGTHKVGSLHYTNAAIDIRVHDQPDPGGLFDEIKKELGVGFDVIWEDRDSPNAHIHIEYDPTHANH